MNNIKNNKKLSLKKETIVALNIEQMNQLKGGFTHVGRSHRSMGCTTRYRQKP